MPSPADTAASFCATLADEWVRCGVTDVVVCPGSRSTPLAVAVDAQAGLRVHVHHDERAGAFMALGLGLATGRPAVLVTTSGTAAPEAHAAVVEAHQAAVPLVVATADRPPELQGVGAPQAIDQAGLFGRSVRWFADPGVPDAAAEGSWRSLAARSVAEACGLPAGPVHLNLPFREPLLGQPVQVPDGRPGGLPWHEVAAAGPNIGLDRAVAVLVPLVGGPGVVVAGRGAGPADDVAALAEALGWPVLADPRAGREGRAVAAFDPILRHRAFAEAHRPLGLVRLGEPPASKVLATWLAESEPVEVVVDPSGRFIDPGRGADLVVRAEAADLVWALAVESQRSPVAGGDDGHEPGSAAAAWAEADEAAQATIEAVLDAAPGPTEPGTARALARCMPEGSNLFLASSMPVRDVEWFGPATCHARVLANRGANGIDGVVSTAIGVALGSSSPTAVLVGDVAFLHDTNALLGLAARPLDLVIVVVDNDGGGIFSFLPQAEGLAPERFERLFGTPHGVDLGALAAAHGLPVVDAGSAAEVELAVHEALAAGGVRVVRVATDRAENVDLHAQLNAAVGAALDDL